MKRLKKMKMSRGFGLLVAIVVSIVTLSSCLKDDNNGWYQISAVRALNAVPGSGQLDIGLDENMLNYDYDKGVSEDFAYGDTLAYKNARPGNRLVRVFFASSAEAQGTGGALVHKTVFFAPGHYYSLFVVGRGGSYGGEKDFDVLSFEDDLTAPEVGKAKIRFMNLSPNAPSLDFGVAGEDELITSNKKFKEAGDFTAIDADEKYRFNIVKNGSGDVLDTFEFTPKDSMIYTIWVKGLLDNTGDGALDFGHGIITH